MNGEEKKFFEAGPLSPERLSREAIASTTKPVDEGLTEETTSFLSDRWEDLRALWAGAKNENLQLSVIFGNVLRPKLEGEDGYDPYEGMDLANADPRLVGLLANAYSPDQKQRVVADFNDASADRELMARNPWISTLGSLLGAASSLDQYGVTKLGTSLISRARAARGVATTAGTAEKMKLTQRLLQSQKELAPGLAVATAGNAVAEVLLHQVQDLRTLEESRNGMIYGVGLYMLLGGMGKGFFAARDHVFHEFAAAVKEPAEAWAKKNIDVEAVAAAKREGGDAAAMKLLDDYRQRMLKDRDFTAEMIAKVKDQNPFLYNFKEFFRKWNPTTRTNFSWNPLVQEASYALADSAVMRKALTNPTPSGTKSPTALQRIAEIDKEVASINSSEEANAILSEVDSLIYHVEQGRKTGHRATDNKTHLDPRGEADAVVSAADRVQRRDLENPKLSSDGTVLARTDEEYVEMFREEGVDLGTMFWGNYGRTTDLVLSVRKARNKVDSANSRADALIIEKSEIESGGLAPVQWSGRAAMVTSAESFARVMRADLIGAGLEANRSFAAYKKITSEKLAKDNRAFRAQDSNVGRLTKAQFMDEVGVALRNNDVVPEERLADIKERDPDVVGFIQEAAGVYRKQLARFEERLKAARLLFPDVDWGKTSPTYYPRMWDRDALREEPKVEKLKEVIVNSIRQQGGDEVSVDDAVAYAETMIQKLQGAQDSGISELDLGYIVGESGSMKGRVIHIEDKWLDGSIITDDQGRGISFLVNNPETVLAQYGKEMSGRLALSQRFSPNAGQKWFDDQFDDISAAVEKLDASSDTFTKEFADIFSRVESISVRAALARNPDLNMDEWLAARKQNKEVPEEINDVGELYQYNADRIRELTDEIDRIGRPLADSARQSEAGANYIEQNRQRIVAAMDEIDSAEVTQIDKAVERALKRAEREDRATIRDLNKIQKDALKAHREAAPKYLDENEAYNRAREEAAVRRQEAHRSNVAEFNDLKREVSSNAKMMEAEARAKIDEMREKQRRAAEAKRERALSYVEGTVKDKAKASSRLVKAQNAYEQRLSEIERVAEGKWRREQAKVQRWKEGELRRLEKEEARSLEEVVGRIESQLHKTGERILKTRKGYAQIVRGIREARDEDQIARRILGEERKQASDLRMDGDIQSIRDTAARKRKRLVSKRDEAVQQRAGTEATYQEQRDPYLELVAERRNLYSQNAEIRRKASFRDAIIQNSSGKDKALGSKLALPSQSLARENDPIYGTVRPGIPDIIESHLDLVGVDNYTQREAQSLLEEIGGQRAVNHLKNKFLGIYRADAMDGVEMQTYMKSAYRQGQHAIRERMKQLRERGASERKIRRESRRMYKELEDDLKGLGVMRDRLVGIDRWRDMPQFVHDIDRFSRSLLYTVRLGGVVISSMADMGNYVMTFGAKGVLNDTVAQLVKDPFLRQARGSEELFHALHAMEVAGGATRHKLIADLEESFAPQSMIVEGAERVADVFSKVTLVNYWNSYNKTFTGVLAADKFIKIGEKVDAGRSLTLAERNMLEMAGVTPGDARQFFQKAHEFGELERTMWTPRTQRWDDLAVADKFKAAVSSTVNRTIVTPGIGDTPAWMSVPVVRLMGQFRSFLMASYNKLLLSGFQAKRRGEAQVYLGLLATTTMGMISEAVHKTLKGEEIISEEQGVDSLIAAGVDRGGTLSLFYELLERIPTKFGFSPLEAIAGVNTGDNQFAPDPFYLAGPVPSYMSQGTALARSLHRDGLTRETLGDAGALMPFSTIFYLRGLYEDAANHISRALDLREVRE